MSEGIDQANVGPRSGMLRQAQQQGNDQRDTEIGMNGTTDLGNNTTVSGGTGLGGQTSGSAAGGTDSPADASQGQAGYGSNPGEAGQQQGELHNEDVQFTPDMADDGNSDDLGDGAGAASAAGGGAM